MQEKTPERERFPSIDEFPFFTRSACFCFDITKALWADRHNSQAAGSVQAYIMFYFGFYLIDYIEYLYPKFCT